VVEELNNGACDYQIIVERDSGTDEEKGGYGGSYVSLLA